MLLARRDRDAGGVAREQHPAAHVAHGDVGVQPALDLRPSRVTEDIIGECYIYLISRFASDAGKKAGEFFTPRNICKMAVLMLDPGERQLVLDPACGTGGFLITAMHHVIAKIERDELAKWGDNRDAAREAIRKRITTYAAKFIVGIDFNPELVKASKMNMVMNNDGAGGLYQANSLENPVAWKDELLRDRRIMGKVDIIFTNMCGVPRGKRLRVATMAMMRLALAWDVVARLQDDEVADVDQGDDAGDSVVIQAAAEAPRAAAPPKSRPKGLQAALDAAQDQREPQYEATDDEREMF